MDKARYHTPPAEQAPDTPRALRRKKGKKRKNFWRFWRRYTFFSLALTALALFGLWKLLAQYEASRPAVVAEKMAAALALGQLDSLEPALAEQQSPFADAAALETALRGRLEGTQIASRSDPENPDSYLLTSDGQPFARVTLEPDGRQGMVGFPKWKAGSTSLLWQLTEEYTVTAPRQASVTLNGQPLAPEEGESGQLDGYKGLPEGMAAPELVRWTLRAAGQPQLTASMEGSGECRVDWQGSAATVYLPASEELQQQLAPLAEEVSRLYARFITQDATFTQLAAHLIRGSTFYTSLTQFYNGWYTNHDSYQFENLELSDFQLYSPDHLSCRIKFDYTVHRGSRQYDFPSAYILYFQHTGDGWKLANLVIQ